MEATDLTGKFILLYSQGVDLHHPTSMEISKVEEISGTIFLVGTQPIELLGRDNWLGKTETFVAWNSITQFHVFDDYNAFKKVLPEEKTAGLFGLFKG